jgi:hypothetical protein
VFLFLFVNIQFAQLRLKSEKRENNFKNRESLNQIEENKERERERESIREKFCSV